MTYVNAAATSARRRATSSGSAMSANTTTPASSTNTAGSSRRARRNQKPRTLMRPRSRELAQQQRRDQVPADDEEDVDAEEAARHDVEVRVVEQDGEHRDRAQAVETAQVAEPAEQPAAATVGSGCVPPLSTDARGSGTRERGTRPVADDRRRLVDRRTGGQPAVQRGRRERAPITIGSGILAASSTQVADADPQGRQPPVVAAIRRGCGA